MRSRLPLILTGAVLFVAALSAVFLLMRPGGSSGNGGGPSGGTSQEARRAELPRDHPREALDFFRRKRAPIGETEVPIGRYVEAALIMEAMPRHSVELDRSFPSFREMRGRGMRSEAVEALETWEELGPGNIGGRTRAFVIEREDPRVMYAAGVSGGVWKSEDAGGTWRPLKDLMANLGVVSLAMDPGNRQVIYAGTGESHAGDEIRGAGIFKTEDGGANWDHLPATRTPDFHHVNDIAVSSADGERVYAATGTGVWRSLNGGTDWTRIREAAGGCMDLALRTDRPADVLFASCGIYAEGDSVWINSNAGSTDSWTEVIEEPGMGRISLAIAPSNQEIIYALAASQSRNDVHAVFRSTRGGLKGTWEARTRNPSGERLHNLLLSNAAAASNTVCKTGAENELIHQGDYDNVIAVDPVNPNRVWVGGIDLFRSDDGGVRWGLASYWWFLENETGYLHADQHALVFHPRYDGRTNKVLFVANDGGVFRTDDALARPAAGNRAPCGGDARFTWTSLSNGYRVTQFYQGTPLPDGRTWFGGTQDNGILQGTEAAGRDSWDRILRGDGGYVAVNPGNPDIRYAELEKLSFRKSTDGGKTFDPKIDGIDGAEAFAFIVPFVMDPKEPRRLWLGGQSLWRTDDEAENWEAASPRLAGGNETVSAIAVAPSDPDRLLAGTSDGRIFRTLQGRTSDRNTAWEEARPQEGYVSSLTFDPVDPKTAYATYSNFELEHVWKSTDGGANWVSIDGTIENRRIEDIPVHSLVVDPANRSHLYVGTDTGVFASTDGGTTWQVENTGFANVITEWLTLGKMDDGTLMLYAFTHGRGAWRVRLPDRAPSP